LRHRGQSLNGQGIADPARVARLKAQVAAGTYVPFERERRYLSRPVQSLADIPATGPSAPRGPRRYRRPR
jgi:hypothetical protein